MKVACVSIAKDEDRYLLEWVNYHLKLGFDDVFVYQNNWRYPHPEFFTGDTHVHLLTCDGHRMQAKCYNNFVANNHMNYDFIACIDIDEFICVKDQTLKEWLSKMADFRCIYLNWRIFGDNGLTLGKDERDFSVLKRFTMCDDRLHRLGKPIINTRIVHDPAKYHNPHIVVSTQMPTSPIIQCDSNGRIFDKYPWLYDNVYEQCVELFHFRNKTYQECYERKFGTDDAFHEAKNCDWRTDINVFNREFDAHNTNKISITTARDFLYGRQS